MTQKKIISLIAALGTIIIIVAVTAYLMMPNIWAKNVPGYLNKNFSPYVVFDSATFSSSPPTLVLNDVHLRNPEQIAPGDAIKIARITVVYKSRPTNEPMQIASIKIDNVHGRYIMRESGDNLATLLNQIILRGQQAPQGELAKAVTVDRVTLTHVTLQNEDGSLVQALNDGVMDTHLKPPAPLQNILVDLTSAVISHQQSGITAFKIENITEKATETLKSWGGALKEYLTTPGPVIP